MLEKDRWKQLSTDIQRYVYKSKVHYSGDRRELSMSVCV